MDDAIDKHFKEEEQKRLKEELRSIFRLYWSPGQWERLQATIAQARAEHKKALEERARQRDIFVKTTVAIVVALLGFVGIYYYALYLKGDLWNQLLLCYVICLVFLLGILFTTPTCIIVYTFLNIYQSKLQ